MNAHLPGNSVASGPDIYGGTSPAISTSGAHQSQSDLTQTPKNPPTLGLLEMNPTRLGLFEIIVK